MAHFETFQLSSRYRAFLILMTLAIVLLTNYQNCAPSLQDQSALNANANGQPSGVSANIGNDDGSQPVSVIDPVKHTTHLSFVETQKALAVSDQQVSLHGLCHAHQNGATLAWRLSNSSGQVLDQGFANCEMGGFQVDLINLQTLPCGESHEVRAQLGAGNPGTVQLSRSCQ